MKVCMNGLDLFRGKARYQPPHSAHTHRQEQSASPYERPLAIGRFRSTDLDVY